MEDSQVFHHASPSALNMSTRERKYHFRSTGGSQQSSKAQHKRTRCHYCRSMDKAKSYIICANYPDCLCGFCYDCLRDYFGIQSKRLKRSWVCVVCHKKCNCARCQQKLVGQMLTPKINLTAEPMNVPESKGEEVKASKKVTKEAKRNYVGIEKDNKEKKEEGVKVQESSEKIASIQKEKKDVEMLEINKETQGKAKTHSSRSIGKKLGRKHNAETPHAKGERTDYIVRIPLNIQQKILNATPILPPNEPLQPNPSLSLKEESEDSPCIVTTGLALLSFTAEDYKRRFKVVEQETN